MVSEGESCGLEYLLIAPRGRPEVAGERRRGKERESSHFLFHQGRGNIGTGCSRVDIFFLFYINPAIPVALEESMENFQVYKLLIYLDAADIVYCRFIRVEGAFVGEYSSLSL